MIPDDPRSPMDPSGIRVGTPALTTRGFKEEDFAIIGHLIGQAIKERNNETVLAGIRDTVALLTKKYPLYPDLMY